MSTAVTAEMLVKGLRGNDQHVLSPGEDVSNTWLLSGSGNTAEDKAGSLKEVGEGEEQEGVCLPVWHSHCSQEITGKPLELNSGESRPQDIQLGIVLLSLLNSSLSLSSAEVWSFGLRACLSGKSRSASDFTFLSCRAITLCTGYVMLCNLRAASGTAASAPPSRVPINCPWSQSLLDAVYVFSIIPYLWYVIDVYTLSLSLLYWFSSVCSYYFL